MKRHAEALLHQMLGPDENFREGQWEAIRAVLENRSRALVVQRTGWGKSLVYFIATKILREGGAGPALLISPLLSLMRNQIGMAERIGIRALTINSANSDEWDWVEERLGEDVCDVLLVSPERLANDRFLTATLPAIRMGLGLFVVDEAHCISDWGHDFRPDYRRIVRIVRALPPTVPVLATTATANDRCERVSAWLAGHGVDAPAYHAGTSADERIALEQRLIRNEVKALVATVALGMGFDKPDLGFVVHFQRPGSVVSYYQQIGRAGRTTDDAYAILLNGREDDEIQDYFIRSAFPSVDQMRQVLEAIEDSTGLTLSGLLARVNLSRARVERCLKLLEVDGAIARDGSRYSRTVNVWTPDAERSRRVTELRRQELGRMQALVDSPSCLMEFVAHELDDPEARPCGRCAVCAGEVVPAAVDPALVREAVSFLKRDSRTIEPRKQWPAEAISGRGGRISVDLLNMEGRALCIYRDAGWGRAVAAGKYTDGRFSDELVHAAVDLIQRRWAPDPASMWVTAIPSLRHPALVPDFAARLAARLGLPYRRALEKVHETPEQKAMENSAQQAANIATAFRVIAAEVLPGPLLLVDDIGDSRWTLTLCGALLREAGSGPVHPFALASSAGTGDSL